MNFQINKHAFSGGQQTLEEHREKGGNTDIDVSYQLLKFFLPSDEELERVRIAYSTGEMLSGEIKKFAIETLQPIVTEHQEKRKLVTEEVLESFMQLRKLNIQTFIVEINLFICFAKWIINKIQENNLGAIL